MPVNVVHKRNRSLQSPKAVPLTSLLQGKRYTWISHGDETYLLQLTKSNKLLLTK